MDLDKIEALLKLLSEHDVREFQFKGEDMDLELKLGAEVVTVAAAPQMMAQPAFAAPPPVSGAPGAPAAAPAADAASDAGLVEIESPMVGTFYSAPSPGADPFVKVGATISAGQPLCIVEAMKLMNEIEAEVAGEIVEICVKDGQPVQFGQALFKIRPA